MSLPDWVEPVADYMFTVGLKGTLQIAAWALLGSTVIGLALGTLMTISFRPTRWLIPVLHRGGAGCPSSSRSSSSSSRCRRPPHNSRSAPRRRPRSASRSGAAPRWPRRRAAQCSRSPRAARGGRGARFRLGGPPRVRDPSAGLASPAAADGRPAREHHPDDHHRAGDRGYRAARDRRALGGAACRAAARRDGEIKASRSGAVMVVFFLISFPLTRLAAYLERRLVELALRLSRRCRRRRTSSPGRPSSSAAGRPSSAHWVSIRVPRRGTLAVGSVRRRGEQGGDSGHRSGRPLDRAARCRHDPLLRQPLLGLARARRRPRARGFCGVTAGSHGGDRGQRRRSAARLDCVVRGCVRHGDGSAGSEAHARHRLRRRAPCLHTALFLLGLILPGLVWFALFGLSVPAAVAEQLGMGDALRRGFALGRPTSSMRSGRCARSRCSSSSPGRSWSSSSTERAERRYGLPPSSRRSCSHAPLPRRGPAVRRPGCASRSRVETQASRQGGLMPTYLMLSRLTAKGVQTLNANRSASRRSTRTSRSSVRR